MSLGALKLQLYPSGVYHPFTPWPDPNIRLIWHFANGGPQVKVSDFDKSSSPVLAVPTLCLIVSIAATYYLTITIVGVINSFQNTLSVILFTSYPIIYTGSSSASL